MMDSRSSHRERLASSGSVLSDDSEMLDGLDDAVFDDVSDPRLRKAVDQAGREKNIMPLIKEELRLSILSRRNKEGKGDVIFEEKKPQVKRPLTEPEKERKLRRQEQNRRAARKCRKKKKDSEVNVMQAYHSEKDRHDSLTIMVEELRKEKQKLEEDLRNHLPHCTRHQSTFVPIQENTRLLPFGACLSPHFDTGMSSTPEPDTPNPTTPHTPGQTFTFSPDPFSTNMQQDEMYTIADKEVCCAPPETTWENGDTSEYPCTNYDTNLDGCFGSEFENIDITPFTSIENSIDFSQYPVANQTNNAEFISQSEFTESRQQTGIPLPVSTPDNNDIPAGDNITTFSGLEFVLDLITRDNQYVIQGNMNETVDEFSQHGENVSCTNLHDI
ncbi:uncharacterized protein LOC133182985 [Saccostrea echinata]|uniref:uncharacterized protein LOC133182985 n=1 Tax=Saccostrea echinata TaxID=191078 RepID=UPI002A7F19FF|nr:uncharacterized protein LOC133182985 [Saccostrea echinata]